jgi:zinc protease
MEMNTRIQKLICTLILALISCFPAFAQKQTPPEGGPPKPFKLPQKQTFALPNGVQITMVPYGEIPKVTVSVTARAGNLNESAEQVWLADLTGQMIREGGTTTRSAQQVAEQAASMGGTIDVTVGPDQTNISSDVLSEFAPQAVALLADVAQHPALPESELPRLKQNLLRQLTVQKSRPQPLAQEQFYKILYPDHPYGRIFPTDQMLNGYTLANVQKFYKDNFGAARTHIYVAGKFDPTAVKKAIAASFSSWPRGPEPLINIPKPVAKRQVELVDRPGAPQSTLYIGLPTINPSNPDYIPLQVMNALLGGSFSSRITSNIREQKGYTYSPSSQLSSRYRDAYWLQVADVTTQFTGPSIKEIFGEIDRLRTEPPTEQELQGIKNYVSGVFVLRNSTRSSVITQLQFVDLHNLGDNYLDTYLQKVMAVTPQQVEQMAQKYIRPNEMTIVVVGDKSKVADQIAPYQSSGQ